MLGLLFQIGSMLHHVFLVKRPSESADVVVFTNNVPPNNMACKMSTLGNTDASTFNVREESYEHRL